MAPPHAALLVQGIALLCVTALATDPAVVVSNLNDPVGMSVDPAGNMLVGSNDAGGAVYIRTGDSSRVSVPGVSGTVHGTMYDNYDGTWLIAATGCGCVYRYSPGRNEAWVVASGLPDVTNVAPTYDGGFLVAATGQQCVFRYAADGQQTLVAGGGPNAPDGSLATTIALNGPRGVLFDAARCVVFVSDSMNDRVIRIDVATGRAWLVGSAGSFAHPCELTLGRTGDLFVADYNNRRIVKVDAATGALSTVHASTDYVLWAVSMALPAGDLYFSLRTKGAVYVLRGLDAAPSGAAAAPPSAVTCPYGP